MIPTALTERETDRLRELACSEHVLELGALLGHSTIALASTAEHVISVDPHFGYPEDNPRPTLDQFLRNLNTSGYADRVTPCVGREDQVLPFLRERRFGFAFIDLTGEFTVTSLAIHHVKPLLEHSATLAVHDYGHPEWPGVAKAVDLLLGRPPELVDTLAIFKRTWPK